MNLCVYVCMHVAFLGSDVLQQIIDMGMVYMHECLCMYTYIHKCVCVYIHTYIYTYIQLSLNDIKVIGCKGVEWNASIHALTDFICTDVSIYTYVYVYVCMYQCIDVYIDVCMRSGMLPYMN